MLHYLSRFDDIRSRQRNMVLLSTKTDSFTIFISRLCDVVVNTIYTIACIYTNAIIHICIPISNYIQVPVIPHHAVNPWGLVLPGSLSANVTCVERWDVCCCNAPWHTRLNPVGPWPWWFCSQFELQEKIELTLKPRPAYALCMHMRYCLTFCVEAGLPKIGRKKHP